MTTGSSKGRMFTTGELFHSEGRTDLGVMTQHAIDKSRREKALIVVHRHPHGQKCNNNCTDYLNGEEVGI